MANTCCGKPACGGSENALPRSREVLYQSHRIQIAGIQKRAAVIDHMDYLHFRVGGARDDHGLFQGKFRCGATVHGDKDALVHSGFSGDGSLWRLGSGLV
ncbi:hypothetical protein FQZ97_538720 [compost metagenome]